MPVDRGQHAGGYAAGRTLSVGRRRLLRSLATAVTTITAALAILIVAVGAVLLGMS